MTTVSKERLIRFLSDAGSYAHRPDDVEIIQTHASIVAIAPPLVFKVKKPVDFGFLDFSTLEKRRHFCEEEIRLNRRMCPDIYEGVVPIRLGSGGLSLDGEGEIVEYAVRMKRLEPPFFMHRLLKVGKLTQDHIGRVVGKLISFYEQQSPPPKEVSEWGRVEKIRISTDENFEQTRKYQGRLLSRSAFEALRSYVDLFLDSHGEVIDRRIADGRILDCHGDLRLGHVHIRPETVCIYDCIEFNERFRYIDVANDIAFLAMELDFADRRDLAERLVEQAADALSDADFLSLIDFYKCYRAVVRGKVEALRTEESEVSEDDRAKSRSRARRHFSLALRYAVAGSEPLVLVVMGRVGTGKTTLSEAIGHELDWSVYSSDRVRKEQAGLDPYKRPDVDTRKELYTSDRTDATYEMLADEAIRRAADGKGTILDATYGSSIRRARLSRALDTEQIPYVFVHLAAEKQAVERRLEERETGEPVVSDARSEDLAMLDAGFEQPSAREDLPLVHIRSDDEVETTLIDTLKGLVSVSVEQ